MKYFHGTTSNYVDSILRDGLRPVNANRWHVSIPENGYQPDVEDPDGYIYLTDSLLTGLVWALARAEYLRARPGQLFTPKGFHSPFRKDFDAPVIVDAKPVLLVVTLPETIQLEIDYKSVSAYMLRGSIPAKAIKVAF